VPVGAGAALERGRQRGVPPKRRYFAVIGWYSVKTEAVVRNVKFHGTKACYKSSATHMHTSNVRRNPGAVVVHVLRTEGLRGLYRGFISNASRNTPGEMIFFATYEQSRHLIKQAGQVKDDIGRLHHVCHARTCSRYDNIVAWCMA